MNTKNSIQTTINFKRDEKQHCYETNGANIVVIGNRGDHTHGSSKVKLKNIVDYKWEQKNYPGRLIAVHMEGIIAYSIKVSNREGMVRVVHIGQSQRALIKGMSGEVLDLQFAHIKSEVLLGCIEETALHIHKIELVHDKIVCTLLLKITDILKDHVPKYDRISWCPYVAETVDDIDEDSSKYLVWVRGNNFHCYSVNAIIGSVGTGEFASKDIEIGCLKFTDNIDCITCAIYSPDGTTLAISSEDGTIRFYQVYFLGNDINPRCLHQWKPHDGKVISSFFFLDNHTKECADNTLWKHAITCSDNNTEIKVWSCETWECTQTIKFKSSPSNELLLPELSFKAEMDRTSSYLVLSDMQNRQLYVLQIMKVSDGDDSFVSDVNGSGKNTSILDFENDENASSGDKRVSTSSPDSENSSNAVGLAVSRTTCNAIIKSIAEFPLPAPILSFGIVDAAVRKYKCSMNDACLIDELDDYDDENNAVYCVIIHMFLVQPKSVQDAHVLYQPTLNASADVLSTISCSSDSQTQLEKIADISNKSIKSIANISNNDLIISSNGESPKQLNTSAPLNISKNSSFNLLTPTSPIPIGGSVASLIQKHSSQLNLMTPESFRSPIETAVKSPEVSKEVLSTLLMLANATAQQKNQLSPNIHAIQNKSHEKLNVLNLVNNKMIEEEQKLKKIIGHESLSSPISNNDDLMANASGGSSPSREVQEILCLQDNNKYYDDTDEIILDEADGLLGVDELNDLENDINEDEESYNYKRSDESKDKISNQNKELVYNIAASEETTTTRSNSGKTDWPKVPDVTLIEQQVAARIALDMSAGSRTSDKTVNVSTNTSNTSTIVTNVIPTATLNQIDNISVQMEKMFDIMQNQSSQMADLRNQIYELQKARASDSQALQNLSSLDSSISKLLDQCFQQYDQKQNKKLENLVLIRDKQNREMYTTITDTLIRSLSSEVPRQLLPILAAKLDGMKQQMHQDIGVKLSSTDVLLRDNLAKVCTNQAVLERFGTSVTKAVQTGLENAFIETMNVRLIPSYEKATKEMLKQIHITFSEATKEYTRQFANYINQLSIAEDRSTEVLEAIRSLPDQIRISHEKIIKACTSQITQDVNKDIKTLQASLVRSLKDEVKNEIQKGFEEQASSLEDSIASVVRSQAQTPAPSVYEVQENIKQMLVQNQINRAFHTALLANDLHLVEFTLEKADYAKVFNPCPLEQTVLLSLVQQISADMSNYNELKHKYLSDAILSLQLQDPITKEHSPKVLRELNQNCQTFITGHPTHPLFMSVKMLMIAIQGLGYKQF